MNEDFHFPSINGARLIERHRDMARIGATGRGGVNRQALSLEDTQARQLLLGWTAARGYHAEIDPIGNLFVRRPGVNPNLSPVMTGSHLDTQPTGGNYDGIFGVLAALEVLETLDDARLETSRSIELIVWMNEEGSRFSPTTMGSAVSAGSLPLDRVLDTVDAAGITVREALNAQFKALSHVGRRALGLSGAAYIEAHIEQGPILEHAGCTIGVVTAIQGICCFEVEVIGFEAHAGTTPSRNRKDALVAAMTIVHRLRTKLHDASDTLRFTVGRFEVAPGSPNTVPGRVAFTIDLRHPDIEYLLRCCEIINALCSGSIASCDVTCRLLLQSEPIRFSRPILEQIRSSARRREASHMDMISGATHDSRYASLMMPAGMVFIPCEKGISHNEAENVASDDLVSGGQVLSDTVIALARSDSI